jgi:SAM-dependent methyltransferase
MKYPDLFLTRFVYKNKLNQRKNASVLEFGCGSGHNLKMFKELGFTTCGVDINFEDSDLNIIRHDLESGIPEKVLSSHFDVILLPNITYYLSKQGRSNLLAFAAKNLTPGGYFFISERTFEDQRWHLGSRVSESQVIMKSDITGELGCTILFVSKQQFILDLTSAFGIEEHKLVVLTLDYENIINGEIIFNSDLIGWGQRL